MSRRLFLLGSLLLLITAALWVADATGVVASGADDQWSALTLKAAMVSLAAALVLRILAPVGTRMSKGRCRVCGRSTERGHTFCLDHLQETVHAGRDASRGHASRSARS
jgi:hypothetical protein